MQLFNSYTNQVETFTPIKPDQVSMYVCGPTVYNHAHIGNARPIVVFDMLRRLLEHLGYSVKYVSNYTDVDDRIINQAMDEHKSEGEISSFYIQEYEKVRNQLNCIPLSNVVKVTESMDQIIEFIEELVKQDKAYQVDEDVYFKIDEAKHYGALSKQKVEDLIVGSRIVENQKKQNPLDFTLWKQTDKGLAWDSEFGRGRPGWHTECVVMIQDQFNQEKIDIHGGGMDLKFPHHENEIAQCEALFHHNLANYWVHNGMLNIDGEKMSKSLGNVVWAKDFIKELGGDVVRLLLLSTHYRAPISISADTIVQAQQEILKVKRALRSGQLVLAKANVKVSSTVDSMLLDEFVGALEDDLNIQNALKALFDTIKVLNQEIRNTKNGVEALANHVNAIQIMLDILGIEYDRISLEEADYKLIGAWELAKANKEYDQADILRKQLVEKGLV
jgi:cysteinyl-tRNA synthetase